MAVIMPFAGYAIYRLVAGRAPLTARRRAVAAGVGGYVGLNVAALAAAIELGVQPSLFATSDATPLYAPFGLSQTIPAMLVAHLLVAGVVEAVVTFGVIAYLQRANLPVLQINTNAARAAPGAVGEARPLGWRWALAGLGTMAVLTPLGLLAPGGAFGEDAPGALDLRKYHLDAAPRGLRHYAGFFHNALFDGYGFRNDDHPALGYLVSAAFGLLAIWIVILAISQFIRVVQRRHSAAPRDPGAIVS
jgi:cobalt/nickel transport system permease protein